MEPVVITISHSLAKEEVVRRLKPALGKAQQSFPVLKVEKEEWTGDSMEFLVRALGQSVGGNVQVGEKDVRLELSLPWLLAKFANVAQRTILSEGRKLLTKD
jgi:putative polyhydroxyalkanoic acid system protein